MSLDVSGEYTSLEILRLIQFEAVRRIRTAPSNRSMKDLLSNQNRYISNTFTETVHQITE